METVMLVALMFATGFVFMCVSGALSVWSVYGFNPIEQVRGWTYKTGVLVYVGRPLGFLFWRNPICSAWYGASVENQRRLAVAMCRDKKNYIKEIHRDWHGEATAASLDGYTVWPSREAALAAGDPDGWYPGAEVVKGRFMEYVCFHH